MIRLPLSKRYEKDVIEPSPRQPHDSVKAPCTGSRSELRDFAGSDLDGRAGLGIAAVPRLSLRHRERAEANQRHAISFAERSRNTFNRGINGGRGLRLADLARACDFINQIGFVHSFS